MEENPYQSARQSAETSQTRISEPPRITPKELGATPFWVALGYGAASGFVGYLLTCIFIALIQMVLNWDQTIWGRLSDLWLDLSYLIVEGAFLASIPCAVFGGALGYLAAQLGGSDWRRFRLICTIVAGLVLGLTVALIQLKVYSDPRPMDLLVVGTIVMGGSAAVGANLFARSLERKARDRTSSPTKMYGDVDIFGGGQRKV